MLDQIKIAKNSNRSWVPLKWELELQANLA